jgi:hypothetical protein
LAFQPAPAAGRGGVEERVERVLGLAEGLLAAHGSAVMAIGEADPALAKAFQYLKTVVVSQSRAFGEARKAVVPHLRQKLLFAIPADFVQAAAADFLAAVQAAQARPDLAAAFATVPVPGRAAPQEQPRDRTAPISASPAYRGSAAKSASPASRGSAPIPATAASRASAPLAPPAPPASRPGQTAAAAANAFDKLISLFVPRPAPAAAPPGPSPEDLAVEAERARLSEAVQETRLVYKYAAGRVAIVDKAIQLRQSPEQEAETALAAESPKVRDVAKALAKVFAGQPGPFMRGQVAVSQSGDLRRSLFLADQALTAGSPSRSAAAELRGKAIPIRNFPRTFAADPILQKLFPLQDT